MLVSNFSLYHRDCNPAIVRCIIRGMSKKKSTKSIDRADPALLLSQDAALALATEMIIDSGAKATPAALPRTPPGAASESSFGGSKKSAPAASQAETLRSSSYEEVSASAAPAARKISTAQSERRLKSGSPAVISGKAPSASKAPPAGRKSRIGGIKPAAGEDEDELAAFFKRKKEVSQNKSVR